MTGSYPVLDRDRCAGCGRCLKVCDQDVFSFGLLSKVPKVSHPERCLDGCDSCVRLCPAKALTFMEDDQRDLIRESP